MTNDLRLHDQASPLSIWPDETGLNSNVGRCAAAAGIRPVVSQGFEQGRAGNEFGRIGIFSGTGWFDRRFNDGAIRGRRSHRDASGTRD